MHVLPYRSYATLPDAQQRDEPGRRVWTAEEVERIVEEVEREADRQPLRG
jgi:hypothetical protein